MLLGSGDAFCCRPSPAALSRSGRPTGNRPSGPWARPLLRRTVHDPAIPSSAQPPQPRGRGLFRSLPEAPTRTDRRPSARKVSLPAALLQNPRGEVRQPRPVPVAGLAAAVAEVISIADPQRQCGFGPAGRRQPLQRGQGRPARVRKMRVAIDGVAHGARANLAGLRLPHRQLRRDRPPQAGLGVRQRLQRAPFQVARAAQSAGSPSRDQQSRCEARRSLQMVWRKGTAGRGAAAAGPVLLVFAGPVSPRNSVSLRSSMKGALRGSPCLTDSAIVSCEVCAYGVPAAESPEPLSGTRQPADHRAQSARRRA